MATQNKHMIALICVNKALAELLGINEDEVETGRKLTAPHNEGYEIEGIEGIHAVLERVSHYLNEKFSIEQGFGMDDAAGLEESTISDMVDFVEEKIS